MSVILDALKKLDREKAFRKNTIGNIAVEILRPDLPRPGKRIGLYFATVSLTAIATLAITYTVMEKSGFLSKSSPPAALILSEPSREAAPVLMEPGALSKLQSPAPVNPPAPTQQAGPASLSREPVRDARDEMSRVAPKIQNPAESRKTDDIKTPVERKSSAETKIPAEPKPSAETKTPATSLDEKKTLIPEKADAVPGSARRTVETTPNVPSATPPSLKLSAIIWYEEPSRRFAMINGNIAMEGSVIEGVKVEEINPTSVRFLHNGQYFEISMSK